VKAVLTLNDGRPPNGQGTLSAVTMGSVEDVQMLYRSWRLLADGGYFGQRAHYRGHIASAGQGRNDPARMTANALPSPGHRTRWRPRQNGAGELRRGASDR
jgi:hypothetical protein